MPLEPGMRLGRYEIRSLLGEGGMGVVYRAFDPKLGREVAIKVLPPDYSADADRLARFEREARAAGALSHENVLTVYDTGAHEGAPYIVSELLEGEDLRAKLDRGPLPLRRALDYGRQIAAGLAAAHEREIVHRDLKPENVFVTADGRAKILDFGIAKLVEAAPPADDQSSVETRRLSTAPGAVIGTPNYMSPEQAAGGRVDHRSDIFSFGCVLYEMLAGRRAFERGNWIDTLNAIRNEDPPELETAEGQAAAPAGVGRLVTRCLEKRPARRFQSAGDLAFALETLSGPGTGSRTVAAAEPAPARGNWGTRLPWLVAGLSLLLAAAAFALPYFRRAPAEERAVRFIVSLPEKVGTIGPPAISPDGRRIAFVALTGDKRMIWVRPLDSLDVRPVAGTEGGVQPFWSPDSRSLGFFSNGKLKRVEVEGGPAQTLADAQSSGGGTWNRDGVIVFAGRDAGGLSSVPAAGGATSAVTELDASLNEADHAWPYFLPDGRHFLFLAQTARREESAIRVGSLDSKETKALTNAFSSVAYAPPGYLLFARDRALLAQPFDARRLELTGEPLLAAEQLDYNSGNARAFFSVSDDGALVFRTNTPASNQLVWFDRAGNRLGDITPPGNYSSPTLSPDERRLTTTRVDPQAAGSDVWLVDPARGAQTRFTFDPENDRTAIWSPDGDRIAFAALRGDQNNIYLKPASGAGAEELLHSSAGLTLLDDWSPDGRYILFQQLSQKTNWDLMLLPAGGGREPEPFLQTEFAELHGHFSPDGRWVAYASSESGEWQIYVQNFPRAGGKWMVSTAGGSQPRWRGDGREIFFFAPDRKLMAVEVRAGQRSFEAGTPRPLFEMNAGSFPGGGYYAATRDGQRFAVAALPEREGPQQLTVVLNWTADLKR